MSQSHPYRFATNLFANRDAFPAYARRCAGIATIAATLSFAPFACAFDLVLPLVDLDDATVGQIAEVEPSPIKLQIDRDESNRITKRPIVDFDIESTTKAPAKKASVVDKKATAGKQSTAKPTTAKPANTDNSADKKSSATASKAKKASTTGKTTLNVSPVEGKTPPFSSAFTDALKDIAVSERNKRPTPARDIPTESLNTTGTAASALGNLKTAVQENVTDATNAEAAAKVAKSKKQKLDLATEVTPSIPSAPAKPKTALTKSPVSPSVASRKPTVSTEKRSALAADLERYFQGLEQKPTPEGTKPSPEEVVTPTVPISNFPDEVIPRYKFREPGVIITRRMASLRPKLAKTLRYYYDRPLNTRDDSAWSVMHSFLGYGPQGMVALHSDRGQRTNAVSWMCQNGPLMGRRLFFLENGYIKGVEGPGYQGHPCQFLAMLAQIGIPRDYPMNIQGRQLDVEDLINSEMYMCASGKELTFKLIAFSHYLNSDATWKSETGETWTIPEILATEMSQPVNGAACGGTHRIMAISCAVRNRELRGEPMDGVYLQAQQYVRQYQRYVMSLQNRDGSFSTDWLKGRADNGDKDRQLQTTGHMLEWMVYSLPRNELSDPRVVQAAEFLNDLMSRNRKRDWEVGPRGHAIRALALYHQRVFERPTAPRVATKPVR